MTTLTGFQLPEPLAPGTAEWWTKYSASKVAAICGLSKWDTERSIYDGITGVVPPQPQTDVQGRGHEFEPLIRGWFSNMHLDWTIEETSTWQHSLRDWQTADPDGIVTLPDGTVELLEIKTADDIHSWGDEVPIGYLVQVMWQMDVIGARRTHLAACGPFELFHRRPKVFVIDYDARDAAVLRERVLKFQARVEAGDQPAADHSRDCDRLSVRYANTSIADDPGVDVPAEIAVPYLEAFAAEAAVALEKKRTGSVLLEYLGSSKKATFNGHTIASRVNSKGAPSIPRHVWPRGEGSRNLEATKGRSSMTEYLIATSGCDDTTRAFVILTDAEAETVKTIASAINVRAGGCKPSLSISLWADASAYEREEATEPIDED